MKTNKKQNKIKVVEKEKEEVVVKFNPLYKNKTNSKVTVSIIESTAPYVFIKSNAMKKMQALVQEVVSDEVGWFMTVYKDNKNNAYIIDDVFLFEQHVHGATTEVNEELLTKFAMELSAQEGFELIWNNIKGWGHSHVNMAVMPSGQDNSQMEFFSKTGFDFFIRVIANKKGDFKVDVYNYAFGVTYLDVNYYILPNEEETALEEQLNMLEQYYLEEKTKIEEHLNDIKGRSYNTILDEMKPQIKEKVRKLSYATSITNRGTTQNSFFDREHYYGGYYDRFGYDDYDDNGFTYKASKSFTIKEIIDTYMCQDDLLDLSQLSNSETMGYFEKWFPDMLEEVSLTQYQASEIKKYADKLFSNFLKGVSK